MSLFAFADTDLKFLVGKEKRTLQILSFVRSKESTRKGDVPPRNMYSNTPKDHMSVDDVIGSPFRSSGAGGKNFFNTQQILMLLHA